ncbi:phosphoglucosamine mutase [Halolamina litorea]|uniref:Phosphoglucosamine mutase n=1 Tax=Halolamina litorea TaxID=1515593 RepID=A0ABD6BTZ4_9EURY|nr:phosphoglucosamine mutase [Halolamina litorea]
MFGTSGIRGRFGDDVTAGTALSVGRAIASEGNGRVVVGRDPRSTGRILVDVVSAGLRECGADVGHLGELPTPTIARAVEWYGADMGVAVTASHNPPEDNGLKLWSADGSATVGTELAAVEDRIRRGEYSTVGWDEIGTRHRFNGARGRHVDAIVDAVEIDPPLRVVLDVGHGSGRLTATALRRLGCTVTTLDGTPEGSFPARQSEPTAENCKMLRQTVAGSDADLGIAHDGDADRMLAVTESGRFVPGDVLLALFARREATAGSRVAAPIDASMTVADELASVGADVTYTRVGDGYVAERTTEPDVVFGGEPSGAWIWPEITRCPDGPLAAAKLTSIVATDGSLDALVDDVPAVPIQRRNVRTERKDSVVETVAEALPDDGRVTTVDGVRVDLDDGWFLVRASGTQPLVRITAEARDEERMASLLSTAEELVHEAIESDRLEQRTVD